MKRLCVGLLWLAACNPIDAPAPVANDGPPQDGPIDGPVDGPVDPDAPPPVKALTGPSPTYDFGTVVLASAGVSQEFVFVNTGNVPLTLQTPLSGDQGFSLTANTCLGSVAAGASCSVTVKFAPTVTAGTRNGVLKVHDTDAPDVAAQVALTGVASTQGALSILGPAGSDVRDFGQILLGAAASAATKHTFTFTNSGGTALGVSSVTVNKVDFTLSGTCANATNIAPGASCTVLVTYSPKSLGSHNASVTVTDSSGGTSNAVVKGTGAAQLTVAINGAGADISVSIPEQVTAGQPQTFVQCPASACTRTYTSPAYATLVVTVTEPGSHYASGWTGCTANATNLSCEVKLDAGTKTATVASTVKPSVTYGTNTSGTVSGVSLSLPPGTSCGANCLRYRPGTLVNVTASTPKNNVFGWFLQGATGAAGTCGTRHQNCNFTLGTGNVQVTADVRQRYTLFVNLDACEKVEFDYEHASLTSCNPVGSGSCDYATLIYHGTSLTATAFGSTPIKWFGCSPGTSCTIADMTTDRDISVICGDPF